MRQTFQRLTESEYQHFLTFPEERLILATRQHRFYVIFPIIILAVISISLLMALIVFMLAQIYSVYTFVSLFMLLTVLTIALVIKVISDWYYHFYIVTSRKIVEITCNPLFSHIINGVLLDQVRIVEIDAHIDGFINDIFDMGSVEIDFDTMSHKASFALHGIEEPNETSRLLSHSFELIMQHKGQTMQRNNGGGDYQLNSFARRRLFGIKPI
jgi:hypothetical protein